MRKILQGSLFSLCLLTLFFGANASQAASPVLQDSTPISAGVVQDSYIWPTSYGNIKIEVLRCDLTNPGFQMAVVPGRGKYTQRATVSQMAELSGAVAVTNGDFYNPMLQGSPIGPSIIDGRIESSPAKLVGTFSLGIDGKGKARIEPMTFGGSVTASNGAQFLIDGLNKTYYLHEPSMEESHTHRIQAYNDFWASPSRGHKDRTELLVNESGVVEDIAWGKNLPYAVPQGKHILQVHGLAEDFIKKNISLGSTLDISYGIYPNRNWQFLLGGHGLLVNEGEKVAYWKDLRSLGGVRARTFAGISREGDTIWLATAQGRTWDSAGMTLDSMGYFMKYLGAWKALNFDGGGSTAMVAKDLGSFTYEVMTHPEGYNQERAVVNGIGIYNTAPEGLPVGMRVIGPDNMLLGESASFGVDRAWDANYHPKDPSQLSLSWSDNGLGYWSGDDYLATQAGNIDILATDVSGAQGTKMVTVLGPEALHSISLSIENSIVYGSFQAKPEIHARTKDGRQVMLSPMVAQWSLEGFDGGYDPATELIKVKAQEGQAVGALVAQIGPHQTRFPLYNGAYDIVRLTIGQEIYYHNGQESRMDVCPIVENDRTLVPLRFVAEAMGGDVGWNQETRQASVFYQGRRMVFSLDELYFDIDGQRQAIDVPARLVNSRTLVPLRLIGETMGLEIGYEHSSRSVTLIKG